MCASQKSEGKARARGDGGHGFRTIPTKDTHEQASSSKRLDYAVVFVMMSSLVEVALVPTDRTPRRHEKRSSK